MMAPDSTPPADDSPSSPPPSPSSSPSPSSQPSPPEGFYRERARRGATPWVIGAIGLAAVGVSQFVPVRHHVESDLRTRSLSALRSAGLTDLDVEVTGRDAELVIGRGPGTRDTDLERAAAIVSGVEGVRVVSTRLVPPGEGPTSGAAPTTSTSTTTSGPPTTSSAASPATTSTTSTTTTASETTTSATATPTGGTSATGTAGAGATTAESSTTTTTPATTSTTTTTPATPTPTATPTAPGGTPGAGPGMDEVQVVREALKELRPILFAKDSARLSSSARTTVRKASAIVAAHPGVQVRIDGHTDDLGDWDVNKDLSAARADSVRQAMISDGVDGGRLSTFAWSEDRPPAPNTSGGNRVRNRSTELIVLP